MNCVYAFVSSTLLILKYSVMCDFLKSLVKSCRDTPVTLFIKFSGLSDSVSAIVTLSNAGGAIMLYHFFARHLSFIFLAAALALAFAI